MLPDFLTDVSINFSTVPPHLDGATARGVLWQAAPGSFLIDTPEVARYLVEDGKHFTIAPHPSASVSKVSHFLRMTPLAALFFQRGMLAFHAAVVAGPAGAILIAGDSGAGKSTLLATMLKRGWHFLTDDIAAVNLDENDVPVVYPHFPEVTLWSDAMEKLEIGNIGKGRQRLSMEKQFIATPQPLSAICRLSVHKDEIEISSIDGMKLFNTLTTLSYNSRIADALLDRAIFMCTAAAIARTVPLHGLRRTRGRWCVDELADLLEKEFR